MSATNMARAVRSLKTLGSVTQALLVLYLVVMAPMTLLTGYIATRMPDWPYDPGMIMAMGAFGLGVIALIVLFPILALIFLIWFHKALSNLDLAGLNGLRASPGWSVGSFFVPVANLFVPMKAMRELWNRSHGEDEYQAESTVGDVSSWWACYMAGCVVIFMMLAIQLFNRTTFFEITTPAGANEGMLALGLALWCGAAVFLLRVIGQISRAQRTLADESHVFA